MSGTSSGDRQRAALVDQIPQRDAFDEFEGDVVEPLIFAAAVNPGDVVMIEFGGRPRFGLKPRHVIGIARQFGRQNLERDDAAQADVGRPQHRRHPAGADRLDEFVLAQTPPAQRGVEPIRRDVRGCGLCSEMIVGASSVFGDIPTP